MARIWSLLPPEAIWNHSWKWPGIERTYSIETNDSSICPRAHLDATTKNLLPLPARNERGEGHSIKWPSPLLLVREEREKTSAGRVVVVPRCAPCQHPDGATKS